MSASLLHNYRLPLSLSSWLTFAIALTFYWITVDPGASYWDCAEYITIASKMEVGHPPGNPIWMLAMRIATIPFPPYYHALIVNMCSGLFMAFASFFLCRIIFVLSIFLSFLENRKARKGFTKSVGTETPLRRNRRWSFLLSSISIGASLCFALCDSAWFSAVEAEVYAMSAFLSALSLWLMVKWWLEKDKDKQIRILILIAYITGISLGVHQLNLLLIPVFILIILYRKHPERINPFHLLIWLIGAFCLIGLILMGLIPGLLYAAESFELLCVNKGGLPYDSGVIIFSLLILILIISLLIFFNHGYSSEKKAFRNVYVSLWMIAFLILGFSSFGMILIRAKGAPPMNEGNPDNIFSLASYIKREQYPSSPLIYGPTPYSKPMFEEKIVNGKPSYTRYLLENKGGSYAPVLPGAEMNYRSGLLSHDDSVENQHVLNENRGYLLSDYKFSQRLTPELNMWFPRITSLNINDRLAYEGWTGMKSETMNQVSVSETIDSIGHSLPRINTLGNRKEVYSYKPTYIQNLRFFIAYQAYYMYFRYLFWNFVGRQNDIPSQGEVEHGNFITGIPIIDGNLPGETEYLPPEIGFENKGRNRYFGIPFILGIIGLVWLLFGNRKKRRIDSLIFLFFFMTGIAIVVYLNQSPGEPRERDYTFLGSYMAFSIWIGAGLFALIKLLIKLIPVKKHLNAITGLLILLPLLPSTLMAFENFDDHDRRYRYEPTFYASSLLDFELPAIIFSHGDNSTFPLWYASEVLNLGQDHTPVDITYLSLPSYILNLKKQGTKGITTLGSSPKLAFGKYLLTRVPNDSVSSPLPLTVALKELYASQNDHPVFPTSIVTLPTSKGDSVLINLHDFSRGSSFLSFKHLMLLDLIAGQLESENPKVIFFPHLIDYSFYRPLDKILLPSLFGKIYAPWMTDSMATGMMKSSLEREFHKLDNLNIRAHYADPVIAGRSARYRGELIIAARELLQRGDTVYPVKITHYIEKYYPYFNPDSIINSKSRKNSIPHPLPPSTFTVSDSTFYEGKEYRKLLYDIHKPVSSLDSLNDRRHKQWLRYYHSLSPSERSTLSNRSKRLLIN